MESSSCLSSILEIEKEYSRPSAILMHTFQDSDLLSSTNKKSGLNCFDTPYFLNRTIKKYSDITGRHPYTEYFSFVLLFFLIKLIALYPVIEFFLR